jgi:hypothetical protein
MRFLSFQATNFKNGAFASDCLKKKCVMETYNTLKTGSGVHQTSYTMGTGGSFPGVKRPRREADHSPPTSAEVKKMLIYTSTPPYAFMA